MGDDVKPPKKRAAPIKIAPAVPKAKSEPEFDDNVVIDEHGKIEETKPTAPTPAVKKNSASAGRWHRLKTWWKSLDRNVRFGIIAGALVVFCALALAVFYFGKPSANPVLSITKHKAKITTVASPLTGLQVDPAAAARPVTGIMIENSVDARPQSGLQDAGVVYEAIAEAGITRFLALFQDAAPQYIGPVRSLRPYFIDYAAPFQASIVHVGGSPDALSEVEDGNYRNLDQFFNGDYFTRVSSRDAPHNVYTSFKRLDQLNKAKGYASSTYTPWPRKNQQKLATPTAANIDFAISGSDYHVHYDYNPSGNNYLRSEGGIAHTDLVNANDRTGVRLKPKVVVALAVPLSQGALDASGAYYSNYSTAGSGAAYVFQDGGVTQGTWTKDGTTGQLQLTDANGHGLKLDAGQTWVTLVSDASQVSYTK